MSGCVRKARLAAARGRGGQAGGRAGAGAGQGEAQLPAAARLPAEEAEQRAQELDLWRLHAERWRQKILHQWWRWRGE